MRRKTENMRYGFTATISSKGQFTIPKALCLRLGIQRGDKVEIKVINGDAIAVRPLKPVRIGKGAT